MPLHTTGTLAYDTTLTLDTVHVNLNGSLEGGGTLWPDILVDLGTELTGQLVVRPGAECGEWTGSFDSTGELSISGDALRVGVELACSNNSFNSPEDCERVRQGAADLSALPITVSDRVWRETVEFVTDQAFDNGFCGLSLDE